MPVQRLPQNPSLERLRKQAKSLLRDVRTGAPGALALVAEFHPRPADPFGLSDAQLVTARGYGFSSWPSLKRHLDVVGRYSRSPHQVETSADPAVEFLRLACLTYGADSPARTRRASQMLDAHPDLPFTNVFTMAATGSADALGELLAAEPARAARQGGPFAWEPLLYLAYARLDPPGDAVESARLLLEHGADPNAGYLWEGLTSPFTALTGAFGGGESDQPAHPRALELARLLLEAGAEANDAQTLYDRGLGGSTADDTAHLELLLEFGLGEGDGGPWRARLGPTSPSPRQLLRDELATAALRGSAKRVRLLLAHGAEVDGIGAHPVLGGSTPYRLASRNGHTEVAEILAGAGASTALGTDDAFVAACMSAEAEAVAALGPEALARALSSTPDLVTRAAANGRPAAVRLLAGLGFEVNHLGQRTPLHEAAWNDDVETARTLVELGADPAVRDVVHDSTPLGWAEYGGKRKVEAYLRGLPESAPQRGRIA